MRKKILAILTLAAFLLSLTAISAFAASIPADRDVAYTDVQGADPSAADIPVYGYIGEDARVTDPYPGDPEEPPIVTPNEINVSVPVKIIWAAFESGGGDVIAPKYTIKNNSSANDIDVELTSFEDTGADNAIADADLTLNLTSTDFTPVLVVDEGVYPVANVALGTLDARDSWKFSFGGTWAGEFDGGLYNPTYSMVLTFSLAA